MAKNDFRGLNGGYPQAVQFERGVTPDEPARIIDMAGYQRRNAMYKYKLFHKLLAQCGTGATFQQVFGVPYYDEPVLVRAVYENDTATTYDVSAIGFNSGRAIAEVNPKASADGSDPTWKLATVPLTVPIADAAYATNGIMGLNYSAPVILNMQARTDGGEFGLIYLRSMFASAAARGQVGNSSRDTSLYITYSAAKKHAYVATLQNGNFTTTAQTTYAGNGATPCYFNPASIEVVGMRNVRSILNVGDSLAEGLLTTGQCNNYALQFCEKYSKVNYPICSINLGSEGQTSALFMAQATAYLQSDSNNHLPTVAIIQVGSGNDSGGVTRANLEAAFILAMQFAQLCLKLGVTPMLKTMIPSLTYTATPEAARVWLNTAIRKSSLPYFDADKAVTDGGSPARQLPALVNADGNHPNDLGHAALAAQLAIDLNYWQAIATTYY
jgi:lysophospholipase L1-like esterase